jgi:hypothetical protein
MLQHFMVSLAAREVAIAMNAGARRFATFEFGSVGLSLSRGDLRGLPGMRTRVGSDLKAPVNGGQAGFSERR